MKNLYALCLLLMCNFSAKAQNHVYNHSFERDTACVPYTGCLVYAEDWVLAGIGSSDLYDTCATGNADVPDNWCGHRTPYEGANYAGFYTILLAASNYREYAVGRMEPLLPGHQYRVTLHVALAGQMVWATQGIGVFFFIDQTIPPASGLQPFTPQIDYSSYGPVMDTVNWTALTDTLLADSAYTHLMIGNFYPDSTTVKQYAQQTWYGSSYYYLDNVEVVDITPSYINTHQPREIATVYPNPMGNAATISINDAANEAYTMSVYNMQGQEVRRLENIRGKAVLPRDGLQAGFYCYTVYGPKGIIAKGRLQVK